MLNKYDPHIVLHFHSSYIFLLILYCNLSIGNAFRFSSGRGNRTQQRWNNLFNFIDKCGPIGLTWEVQGWGHSFRSVCLFRPARQASFWTGNHFKIKDQLLHRSLRFGSSCNIIIHNWNSSFHSISLMYEKMSRVSFFSSSCSFYTRCLGMCRIPWNGVFSCWTT